MPSRFWSGLFGFQLVSISVSSCDLGVELYTQDLIKFLGHRLFQDIFFKIITSDGGRSFIHYFVERVEILRMFIHSDRVKVLYCFGMKLTGTWKHVPPSWDAYEFVVVWFSFVFALLDSVWYRSRAEQKTPKYSSKWTLNVGNLLLSGSSAWRSSLSSETNLLNLSIVLKKKRQQQQ